jgi:hypothetical protein
MSLAFKPGTQLDGFLTALNQAKNAASFRALNKKLKSPIVTPGGKNWRL